MGNTSPEGRAQLQGFCGLTRITPGLGGQPDVCTWHRRWDVQPPRSTPDAGTMVFETPERVIETGVHGRYLEVWERLPGSTGPYAAQTEVDAQGRPTGAMRFTAGRYTLTVRPRRICRANASGASPRAARSWPLARWNGRLPSR